MSFRLATRIALQFPSSRTLVPFSTFCKQVSHGPSSIRSYGAINSEKLSNNFPTTTLPTGRLPKASGVTPNTRALRRSGQSLVGDKPQYLSKDLLPCTSITTCKTYDLPKVIELLHQHGYKDASFLIPQEVVYLQFPNVNNQNSTSAYQEPKFDIMVLLNGSVIAWGYDETFLINNFLPLVEPAKVNPYQFAESEEIDFVDIDHHVVGRHGTKDSNGKENRNITNNSGSKLSGYVNNTSKSRMDNDIIIIDAENSCQKLLDKAAFAFGVTRSTRLAILETLLENCIQETRQNTITFSKGITKRNKSKQRRDTLQIIGRLLLIRGELNLYSELTETPDLYWSEPVLEELYKKISKNLDIVPRIGIMNTKLDYATEESQILVATLNDEKLTKLDTVIVYLILIGVCFQTFHFYDRYVLKKKVASVEKEKS